MKKITCFLLMLLLFYKPFAQTETASLKEQLWQKSKSQRTIGWVLLGTGTAVGIIGLVVASNHLVEDIFTASSKSSEGWNMVIAGGALIAGSIPFFIMAGKNRRLSLALTSFQKPLPATNQLLTYQKNLGLQLTFTQTIFR